MNDLFHEKSMRFKLELGFVVDQLTSLLHIVHYVDVIPSNASTPHLCLPSPLKGISILGVPLGASSFTSSFIKNIMVEDIRHIHLFLRMGDV